MSPPNPERLLISLDEDNEAVLTSSSSGATLFVRKADASNEGDRLASAISKLSLTVSGSPALSVDAYIEELVGCVSWKEFLYFISQEWFRIFIALPANAEREVRISRICAAMILPTMITLFQRPS